MHPISEFTREGLCVIPVRLQSKQPIPKKWQQRTAEDNDLDEFSPELNVGVVLGESSGNVVDIDLDSETARKVAPYFLPETGWVFGRKSAPRSHWIYRVGGEAGGGCKVDVSGKFAEYRADRQMTVFPPSIHPSGEQIKFEILKDFGRSSREELLDALDWMAAVAVVAPVYRRGKRNETILAICGTLLALGKTENEVLRFVDALCELTSDEEKDKRLEAVRSTNQRRKNDEGFTQKSHLVDLIGEQATNDLCRHLGVRSQDTQARSNAATGAGVLCADDLNDTGVSKQFADYSKDRLLFVKQTACFHVYKDGIWELDLHELDTARELDRFIEHRVNWLRSNPQEVPHDQCASQVKFLLRYRNRTNARNALKQARSFLCVPFSKLDQGDGLVAVRNGVLDLKDGTLLPFSPQHFVTKRLDVTYDPNADCPAFKKLLSDAFQNDDDLISYVKGILGYCLTGDTIRQEVYVFYGSGANGKSTLVNAITHVLGPYSGTLMSETIFEGMGGQHTCDLASMHGKRLAVVHEAESKFRLNAPRIKQLTGGDTIKVKALYRDPIEMLPKFKIVILCNKRPNLDSYDSALKRRVKLVPFEFVVPYKDRNPRLGEKLSAEASGILNFMIEGARMHFRGEIREPRAVEIATQDYFSDHDSIKSFLQDATIRASSATVSKRELHDAYCQYCNDECLSSVSKRDFGKILIKIGFQDTRGATERRWKGLRLSSPGGREETFYDVFSDHFAA